MQYEALLQQWLGPLEDGFADADHRRRWFAATEQENAELIGQYQELHLQAIAGELAKWQQTDRGTLALIILLDQFSRTIYRGKSQAFAQDAQALKLAKEAIAKGVDLRLKADEKLFLYLPLEHSEQLEDQAQCVALFEDLLAHTGSEYHSISANYLQFAEQHLDIIRQFGRFPHRNEALGRASRQVELRYLSEDAQRFGQ
ncbi:DUF924 family protein [Motilimonas pumila]|uniref:DUF924 domain-containing protein n=1 Tax=Motilimonas pumila TaxID=2303987 RepID=A0A418YCM5_9GAMM|nr:DUF924 family protein [Motilimonas pumila]RJG42276.1 DUF924 domain-containing protein [Motilimonas pumila]